MSGKRKIRWIAFSLLVVALAVWGYIATRPKYVSPLKAHVAWFTYRQDNTFSSLLIKPLIWIAQAVPITITYGKIKACDETGDHVWTAKLLSSSTKSTQIIMSDPYLQMANGRITILDCIASGPERKWLDLSTGQIKTDTGLKQGLPSFVIQFPRYNRSDSFYAYTPSVKKGANVLKLNPDDASWQKFSSPALDAELADVRTISSFAIMNNIAYLNASHYLDPANMAMKAPRVKIISVIDLESKVVLRRWMLFCSDPSDIPQLTVAPIARNSNGAWNLSKLPDLALSGAGYAIQTKARVRISGPYLIRPEGDGSWLVMVEYRLPDNSGNVSWQKFDSRLWRFDPISGSAGMLNIPHVSKSIPQMSIDFPSPTHGTYDPVASNYYFSVDNKSGQDESILALTPENKWKLIESHAFRAQSNRFCFGIDSSGIVWYLRTKPHAPSTSANVLQGYNPPPCDVIRYNPKTGEQKVVAKDQYVYDFFVALY